MMFLVIGTGLGVLAILFRLAALTVFHSWYQANATMADNILFVLVGLVILSWLFSLGKCVWSFIREQSEDRAAVEYFAYRVRNARENGEDTISTEGLWR